MNIQIKVKGSATGFTITDAMSDYVNKRCESFTKFLANDPSAMIVVELGKTTEHQKRGDIFVAEIHIVAKIAGKPSDLYASAEAEDLYAAVDLVRDEAFREITSTKAKHTTLMRRSGARVKNLLKGLVGRNGS